MKKLLTVLVVLLVIAIVTKPSDSDIKEKAKISLQDKIGSRNILTAGLVNLAVNNGVRINDYYVCKTVDFTFDGETKQIGWAAFGYINMNK